MSVVVKRRLVVALLVLASVLVVLTLMRGGEERFQATAVLKNAAGLREGSTVRIGGVLTGRVSSLELDDRDRVRAAFKLDPGTKVPGAGFDVAVRSANLIGEKFLEISGGDPRRPSPDGVVVPPERTSVAVELDEVLDVLEPDTRTRVQILINELGRSLTGRQADFAALLEQSPAALDAMGELVGRLAADNRELGRTLDASDGFVRRINAERDDVGRLVENGDAALAGLDTKRREMASALREAPAFLDATTGFLNELERTAAPLRPAADLLTASAPGLRSTLAALEPFTEAAKPTLADAVDAARPLSKLARGVTPVLRQTLPTLRTLADTSEDLKPVTQAADLAIDDVLGLLEGWARSIQGRDGIGHVFRGRFSGGADLVKSALTPKPTADAKRRKTSSRRPADVPKADAPASGTPRPAVPKLPALPKIQTPELNLGPIRIPPIRLPDLTGAPDQEDKDAGTGSEALLDFLLGP